MTTFFGKRLHAEWDRLKSLAGDSSVFQARPLGAAPPSQYLWQFAVAPLAVDARGRVLQPAAYTRVAVSLPATFPMCQPIVAVVPGPQWRPYYPNVAPKPPHTICLGLAHNPAIWLADIAFRVWDILRLANYRLDHVMNPEAAQHVRRLSSAGHGLPLCTRPLTGA